ncbi:MAG: hypothetical protein RBR97_19575 [Bacteroidales bacterium]|nr:hypothetical protein [Bacteroidales bacterium]
MAKTTIGFYVSQEVADRTKELFPEGRTEGVLTTLLDLYESAGENKNNSDNEQYREIVESICNTYTIEPQEVIDFINAKNDFIFEAERVNSELKDENGLLKTKCEQLEKMDWIQVRTTIKPFAVSLIELTAVKLSEKYGRTVEPMEILVDMFMRYTIERWNQWFYPFQLDDSEIVQAAQAINPEINSISQIKKTLPV